jgi:hypothetical protein
MTYSIDGTTYTNSNGIFTLVPAGTYAVTAKNAAGCVSSGTNVTINSQPLAPATPTASATLQPNCAVATGTITVTAPTGSGLTYSINGTTYTNSNGIFTGLSSGNYYVTAKNASGCVSPQSVKLSINAQPEAPVVKVTNPIMVILPSTVDLTADEITAGSTPGLDFTYWMDEAATIPFHTPKKTSSGTYYIKGTLKGSDCFDIQQVVVLVTQIESIGVNTTEASGDNLSAYSAESSEIRVKGNIDSRAVAILYDINGRVVLVKNLDAGSMNIIRTPDIKAGIYILFVKDLEQVHCFKIPLTE